VILTPLNGHACRATWYVPDAPTPEEWPGQLPHLGFFFVLKMKHSQNYLPGDIAEIIAQTSRAWSLAALNWEAAVDARLKAAQGRSMALTEATMSRMVRMRPSGDNPRMLRKGSSDVTQLMVSAGCEEPGGDGSNSEASCKYWTGA
jgi:hypothetical protein